MESRNETALRALDEAMETEREGIKIYEEAAAKVQDAKAKEIFLMLADAEQQHLSDIEGMKRDVSYTYSTHAWKGDFSSEIGREIEAIGRQYLPKSNDEIFSASALDAVDMGIKVERDSIAFYSDAQNRVTEPGVAYLFNILLVKERVHLFLLELHRDIITGVRLR
ncbi:ferritin family protein [Chloroflexota bacterium]